MRLRKCHITHQVRHRVMHWRSVSFALALLQVLGVLAGLQSLHCAAAGAALGLEPTATYWRKLWLADRRELVLVRLRERAPARRARGHLQHHHLQRPLGRAPASLAHLACGRWRFSRWRSELSRKPRRPPWSYLFIKPRNLSTLCASRGSTTDAQKAPPSLGWAIKPCDKKTVRLNRI